MRQRLRAGAHPVHIALPPNVGLKPFRSSPRTKSPVGLNTGTNPFTMHVFEK